MRPLGVFTRAMIATLLVLASADAPCLAGIIHDYELNGSFADSLGGPALAPAGGTLNATNYSFGANQGLSLSSWLTGSATSGNYSIETTFNFSNLSSFRKIIDFKDLTSDNGLYNLNTALNFFPEATGPSGAFTANVNAHLVLTRDGGTNQVVGYVNGVQQISFTDSSSRATFTGTNNIIQFFKDDFNTGQTEASGGVVDFIRIYDSALTRLEVAALEAAPAPQGLVLAALGAAGLATWGWRRAKAVAA